MSGTSSDNEWCNEWQRMVKRVKTSGNEWKGVTKSDSKWQRMTKNDNEWQQMTASDKTNENE